MTWLIVAIALASLAFDVARTFIDWSNQADNRDDDDGGATVSPQDNASESLITDPAELRKAFTDRDKFLSYYTRRLHSHSVEYVLLLVLLAMVAIVGVSLEATP